MLDSAVAEGVSRSLSAWRYVYVSSCFQLLLSSCVNDLTAFPPRTHAEQVRFAQQYAVLTSQSAREEFVRKFASRWSELARLPYFDVCRMIVIDPMHNLLLGLFESPYDYIQS